MSGSGFTIDEEFSASDGMLDVFLLDKDLAHLRAVGARYMRLGTKQAGLHYWRGKSITIMAEPDRPVWADGEYVGRTPVTAEVVPGALSILVP
jgi:diacylglycerol kinase family enzyme